MFAVAVAVEAFVARSLPFLGAYPWRQNAQHTRSEQCGVQPLRLRVARPHLAVQDGGEPKRPSVADHSVAAVGDPRRDGAPPSESSAHS